MKLIFAGDISTHHALHVSGGAADAALAERLSLYKENLKKKIEKANEELKELKYEFKTN